MESCIPMLFSRDHPIIEELVSEFLCIEDHIRLLHVSKTARKYAQAHIKKAQNQASTQAHAQMFRDWLKQPRVTKNNQVFQEFARGNGRRNDVAGPLRLKAIQNMSQELSKRFVVLEYKKAYDRESSAVALFDEDGAFVSLYKFSSEQFYEDYLTKNQMNGEGRCFNSHGSCNSSMPNMALEGTGALQYRRSQKVGDKWKLTYFHTEYLWQEGWCGDVAHGHYSTIESFAGTLSPTEIIFVLMHALSADTRGIFVYTSAVFDYFTMDLADANDEYEWYLEDPDNEVDESAEHSTTKRWLEKLGTYSYKHPEETSKQTNGRKRARGNV